MHDWLVGLSEVLMGHSGKQDARVGKPSLVYLNQATQEVMHSIAPLPLKNL